MNYEMSGIYDALHDEVFKNIIGCGLPMLALTPLQRRQNVRRRKCAVYVLRNLWLRTRFPDCIDYPEGVTYLSV